MSNTVMVAIDGSNSSKRAADEAIKYAKLAGSDLILTHVIPWSPYSFHTPDELAERKEKKDSEIKRANEYLLAPEVKRLESMGVNLRSIVRHGDIGKSLNKIAKEENVGQIFMGTHGESRMKTALFGSVVMKVVQAITLPITLVH